VYWIGWKNGEDYTTSVRYKGNGTTEKVSVTVDKTFDNTPTEYAAVIDGWKLRVPNWITFPLIVGGWVYSTAYFGWAGLGWSLLGTVVGVMITFAAVAQAGDVNVNAIAPGIAAALLATVAGLAVAIPALFGYNYLLTRIKNATSDMHIFIDEFVTKLAEFYRE